MTEPDLSKKPAPLEDLIDTIKKPDPAKDPAKEIRENGEPFQGNNA